MDFENTWNITKKDFSVFKKKRGIIFTCIVGTEKGTSILEDGLIVTVDGKTGNIYAGFIEIESQREFLEVYQPSTSVKVNINVPEIAASVAPFADGVGSIRIENMVRKMVNVLLMVGSDEMDLDEVETLLNPNVNQIVLPAPPENLILMVNQKH